MGAVVIAALYVPRPPDDNIWNSRPRGITTLQMPVGGGLPPFVSVRWQFDYYDAPVWRGESKAVPAVGSLVGGNYPFKPRKWQLDYQEQDSLWFSSSFKEPLTLTLPTAQSPFTSSKWKFDLDYHREWSGSSGSAFELLSQTLQLYSPAVVRPFPSGDDGDKWSGNRQQINNLLLNAAVVTSPFAPKQWLFDYSQLPEWASRPVGISVTNMPVGGGYPFKADWKVNYRLDDPPTWRGAPSNVSIVQQIVVATPLIPHRWAFNNDDPSFWTGSPANLSVLITQPLPPPTNPEIHPVYHFANVGSMMTRI